MQFDVDRVGGFMRLRVVTDKNNRWMQLFDSEVAIKSVRPATAEEVWMFGELDSRIVENNLMENRIQALEADLEEARLRAGAAEVDNLILRDELESLESARETDRKQHEEIISSLQARVKDLEEELDEDGL
jgi:uncharacterized protein YceH (UPF0502 family)